MAKPRIEELIERKRDGGEHSAADMYSIVLGFTRGDIPDYQMSAWLMAAVLRGLSHAETVAMTEAMVSSGDRVDLSRIPRPKVDKHSTGGVADTTTLVLAPLVASCGVCVAKMSGRGLGHTGGTLDKLEAIPGFSVNLSMERFVAQVRDSCVAVIAQSADIDPADAKIYALRDVTGTVNSIPLIVSSIVSKKVAGGADAVVYDVKVGSGAFMKDDAHARELARELVSVSGDLGLSSRAIVSSMEQPLGNAIGNSLEVREAIEVLKGAGSQDLREVVFALGEQMLVLSGVADDRETARTSLETALASGAALAKFQEWVGAQGGDPRVVDDPGLLPRSPKGRVVKAPAAGFLGKVDAEELGRVAMMLGAGRVTIDSMVDPAAGIQLLRRLGSPVEEGEPLAMVYGSTAEDLDAAEKRFLSAVNITADAPELRPLFQEL